MNFPTPRARKRVGVRRAEGWVDCGGTELWPRGREGPRRGRGEWEKQGRG